MSARRGSIVLSALAFALAVTSLAVAEPKPTPMVKELLAVIDRQKLELAEIRREVRLSRNQARRLELERRVETIKRDTELQLLQIQLGYAKREGRFAVAQQLESAITQMTAPTLQKQRAERPSASPALTK